MRQHSGKLTENLVETAIETETYPVIEGEDSFDIILGEHCRALLASPGRTWSREEPGGEKETKDKGRETTRKEREE